MKKFFNILTFFSLLLLFTTGACSRKTGCPMNDPARVSARANPKGDFKPKKSRSALFPKDMRKSMKKGK